MYLHIGLVLSQGFLVLAVVYAVVGACNIPSNSEEQAEERIRSLLQSMKDPSDTSDKQIVNNVFPITGHNGYVPMFTEATMWKELGHV